MLVGSASFGRNYVVILRVLSGEGRGSVALFYLAELFFGSRRCRVITPAGNFARRSPTEGYGTYFGGYMDGGNGVSRK